MFENLCSLFKKVCTFSVPTVLMAVIANENPYAFSAFMMCNYLLCCLGQGFCSRKFFLAACPCTNKLY